MQKKRKLTIDVLMLIGMFFAMSFHLFGMGMHKMIGLFTIILFIVHNVLHREWWKKRFQGGYSPLQIAHAVNNVIVLIATFGIAASGVMLSKDMADGLHDAMTAGRILHLSCSYLVCLGIALHIGFHLKGKKDHD